MIHFPQQTTNDSCYLPDFLGRAKQELHQGRWSEDVKNVRSFDPNPRSLRDMAGADRPGPPPCTPPPPLTIVHPPPDWALGEWVPVLCLDELIGKRCAASPHRLSCPHQDADLDNTPRCPRTHSPGVAQVRRRLENRFVWEEGLKNEVHEAKRNNNCPAHNVALLHFWVVSLQREPQQSQGSSEFGTVVKEVTQNCPLSTFRPQKGLGKKK